MLSGEIKAGDRLPAERDLAEMLAVSRTALREALRSLEIAGIVVLKKGSKGGAFITEGGAGQVPQSFRDMLDFGRVSLADLLDARLLVMDVVVRTACERAGPVDFERLRPNLAETTALTKAERYEQRTMKAVEFSTILADATGNPVLSAILEARAAVIRGFLLLAGPMAHEGVISSRRRLIEQLEARDVEGAQATMQAYLTQLNAFLLDAERRRRRSRARGSHETAPLRPVY